jgi:hypothetical protein
MAKFELVSPFPLVECQRLLDLGLQRSTAVEGSIKGTRLRARKRIFYSTAIRSKSVYPPASSKRAPIRASSVGLGCTPL